MTLRDCVRSERPRAADLDARYGKIGISAVAAALRYGGESRNPMDRVEPAPVDAPAKFHQD